MEREEKGRAREGKKQEEFMGIKLQRGILVGKRGGTCTTPSPTWKFGSVQPRECSRTEEQDLVFRTNDTTTTTTLSARKLGANLWEALPLPTAAKMSKVGGARFPHRRRRNQKDKGFQLPTQVDEEIPGKPHEEVRILFSFLLLRGFFLLLICLLIQKKKGDQLYFFL